VHPIEYVRSQPQEESHRLVPTYYAVRLGLLLARIVSRPMGYRICTALGLLFWVLNAPARRTLSGNLRCVVGERGRAARHRLVSRLFVNLTKDYYELMLPAVERPEHVARSIEVAGLERVDAARVVGKGVVLVPFHMSGFNLAAQAAVGRQWPAWAVAEPLHPERMRRLVDHFRAAHGLGLIAAERSGTRKILRALRANEVVVVAGDRGVTGTGVRVRLFGVPAVLPAAPAVLALRTGAALLPVLNRRLPDDRILIEICDPVPYRASGAFDADVQRIAQAVADVFERHIRRYPDQWVVAKPVWAEAGADLPVPERELAAR